ncbi:hypothetical protein R1sor_023664 [Riccia sorocarpa]|uniref:DDE Tnp4 domain-containing protein n=1 Tax=Riccia sorocarpa TaxID=122646 RepID=A0ABD3GP24_9MARC
MITAGEKWKILQEQLPLRGVEVESSQIKSKWERLAADFKHVHTWNGKSGSENQPADAGDPESPLALDQPEETDVEGALNSRHATQVTPEGALEPLLLAAVVAAVQAVIEERSLVWFDYFLVRSYELDRWKRVMHMPKQSFDYIVHHLSPRICTSDTQFRKAVPLNVRVGAVIHRLVTGHNYFHVGDRFGIGVSTVQELMLEGVEAIISELGPEYLRLPSREEMERVYAGFELKSDLPNIQGAIDCTFLRIKALVGREIAVDFYNQKGYHAIILQAITYTNGMFLDISAGASGCCKDKRVFRNSAFYDRVRRGEVLNSPVVRINDNFQLCPYLLADARYCMSSWLTMPYSHGPRTSTSQKFFTDRQLQGRLGVERSFGLLKLRFNLLQIGITSDCGLGFQVGACMLHTA